MEIKVPRIRSRDMRGVKPFNERRRTMKRFGVMLIGVILSALLFLTPASADQVTWYLSGVTLSDGGSVSGYFTTGGGSFDIVVSGPGFGYILPGPSLYSYDVITARSASFYGDFPGPAQSLGLTYTQLVSPGPVPVTGGAVGGVFIPEAGPGTGPGLTIPIVAGQLTTSVPEPSILLLLGTGLAGLCVCGRKKFKMHLRRVSAC